MSLFQIAMNALIILLLIKILLQRSNHKERILVLSIRSQFLPSNSLNPELVDECNAAGSKTPGSMKPQNINNEQQHFLILFVFRSGVSVVK